MAGAVAIVVRTDGIDAVTMSGAIVERVGAGAQSPLWGEHRARYHFAGRYANGQTGLDIACGTGFGAAILRSCGIAAVTGFDLSWDALLAARGQRISCACADGTRMPLADASFDLVTSFETVEHVARYGDFVHELARVLKPTGTLILSTPNALITKPVDGKPRNPFHVREFTPGELRGLLASVFRDVALFGQRPAPRHRPCPYWEGNESAPGEPPRRLKRALWKLTARCPEKTRDALWQAIHGVSFFPQEHDWVFDATPHGIDAAHALVAVCRN